MGIWFGFETCYFMAAVNKLSSNFRCFLCGNVEDGGKQKPMYIVSKSRFPKWKQVTGKKGLEFGSKLCGVHFAIVLHS